MSFDFQRVIQDTQAKSSQDKNQYLGNCPLHDDKRPSLSFLVNEDKPLFKCHAGCSQNDVFNHFTENYSTKDLDEEDRLKLEKKKNSLRLMERILDQSTLLTQGDPAWKYFEHRGIPHMEKLDRSFMFHPNLYYKRDSDAIIEHPAILFPILNEANIMVGLHRIYITKDGFKIPESPQKKILGSLNGGTIKWGEAQNQSVLHIGEGPETALGVYQCLRHLY